MLKVTENFSWIKKHHFESVGSAVMKTFTDKIEKICLLNQSQTICQ